MDEQVTRLLCGGFVLGIRLNQAMCDASGIVQFMDAVADLARGAREPAVSPAWSRELLDARKPPKLAFHLREYNDFAAAPPAAPSVGALGDMVMRTFSFSPGDVAALKVLSAAPPRPRDELRRARVVRLARPRQGARDPRRRGRAAGDHRQLQEQRRAPPARSYYGNVCVPVTVAMPAEALRRRGSLADVVEQVREAKKTVNAEYVRSVADTLVMRGRPAIDTANLLLLSDVRLAGFHRVDFDRLGRAGVRRALARLVWSELLDRRQERRRGRWCGRAGRAAGGGHGAVHVGD